GTYAAVIANYAMHAVGLGYVQRNVSGDWPGAAAKTVAERLGSDPIVLMTNGAAGNLNPPGANQPSQVVQGYGQTIAAAIIAALQLQAIRIGDMFVVAVNGEIFSRFTAELRAKTTDNLFVVGYANRAFGYVPTGTAYEEGGYEVDQAHYFHRSFRARRGSLEL